MRVLFIGTIEFSKAALQKLVDIKANIVGVVTKEKSDFNSDFVDLTVFCKQEKIPFAFGHDVNSEESITWIKDRSPDVIYCFGWSSLLKKEILAIPNKGVVGYHPAQLPMNRGRHPLIWALVLGLSETASTFFMMDDGADSGDIISQKTIKITAQNDARTLYDKITATALEQIPVFHKQLENNSIVAIKQDHSQANTWRKRKKEDGKIDFRMTSQAIYNLVRALSKPYIGAHLEYQKNEIKVWKVMIEKCDLINFEPGKVLEIKNDQILVKTFDGAVRLIDHEFKQLPIVGEYV